MRSAQDEGVRDTRLGGDPHRFHLHVLLDRFEAAFPAEPASLVAAEGRREADGAIGVDPDRADPELLRSPYGAADILGPNAGRQPKRTSLAILMASSSSSKAMTASTGP